MSTPASTIRSALEDPNVLAFLRVIRAGESSQNDDAFTVVNGGSHFVTPPWLHPSHGIPTTRGGRAAGAYQFLGTTWGRLAEQYPDDCSSFDPAAQNFGAVALICGRGALDAVKAGDLAKAIDLLAHEWVSLPSMPFRKAVAVFEQYGGGAAATPGEPAPEQPAAPIIDAGTQYVPEESPMAGIADTIAAAAPAVGLAFGPIGGLIGGLASALIKGFAPLAQEKLAKEVGRYTSAETAQEVSGLLTNGIVDIAQKLTGKADPVEAVVAARNDPAVMAQLEAQTMTRLDELAPMFDRIASYEQAGWKADEDSRSAAATRAISEAGSKIQWRQVTFTQIAFGAGTLAVASLLALQIVKGQPINEGLAGLFLMLLTSIANTFRTQNDYSFGSSHGSDAKSATMAEIAARRPRAQP